MIRTMLKAIDGDRGRPDFDEFFAAECMRRGVPFYQYTVVNGNYKPVHEVLPLIEQALGPAEDVTVESFISVAGLTVNKRAWVFGESIFVEYQQSGHPKVWSVGQPLTEAQLTGLAELAKFMAREKIKNTPKVGLMVYDPYNQTLDIQYQAMPELPFLTRNYSAENVAGFEALCAAVSGECHGRLTIMQGPPGTGKTHFLRALVSHFVAPDADLDENGNELEEAQVVAMPPNFVFTPVEMMVDLCNPKQLPALLAQCRGGAKTVLLVEDGNDVLQVREAGKASAVGTFLQAVDGFLGEMMNLHVVVTSNLEVENFDPAVVRKGRLNAKLMFDLLPTWQAEQIIKEETGQSVAVAAPATLGDIYAMVHEVKKTAKETK